MVEQSWKYTKDKRRVARTARIDDNWHIGVFDAYKETHENATK